MVVSGTFSISQTEMKDKLAANGATIAKSLTK